MPDESKRGYPDPHHFGEFREDDPIFQNRILSYRVDALTKEKETLEVNQRAMEKRIAAMEKTFQRGAGAMIVIPIIGAFVGFLFSYGKVIFAPWMGDK
jgi:hypothetical protein